MIASGSTKRASTRLTRFVHAVSCPLVVVRDDGMVLETNRAAAELFEVQVEALRWKPIESFVVSREGSLEEILRTGDASWIEACGRTSSGRELELVLSMHRRSKAAAESASLCTILDLTRQRRLQRQLERSQRLEALAQLATGVVHELSTPMQFVGDNVEFLSETIAELADHAHVEDAVEDLEKSIRATLRGLSRMQEIIGAVRGFAHPRRGQREAVALRPIVDETLVVARTAYKHVATVDVTDSLTCEALCCPADVRQVVLSLVVNAAQALAELDRAEPGHIQVELSDGPGVAIIRVVDNGGGVPDALQEQIFEPYFSTKDPEVGTGQGLAIARHLIEARGGRLTLLPSDVGAIFEVVLPCADSKAETSTSETGWEEDR